MSKEPKLAFEELPPPVQDPIFESARLAKNCGKDGINGTIGIIVDDDGKPVTFECVRSAGREYAQEYAEQGFAYPPLSGDEEFLKAVIDSVYDRAQNVAAVASVGGTGAIGIALRTVRDMGMRSVLLPVPSWANHASLIAEAQLKCEQVPYLADDEPSFAPLIAALKEQKDACAVLLQACCHNPTGRQPEDREWQALYKALKNTNHTVILDMAYHGLGVDFDADTLRARELKQNNIRTLVTYSLSKNHCLYGLRTGALLIPTDCEEEQNKMRSHCSLIGRRLYSMAPSSGQRIAAHVRKSHEEQWRQEVAAIRESLRTKRELLRSKLPSSLARCLDGQGMFALLPLSTEQLARLRSRDIHLTPDGRVNIAGIPADKIERFAEAIIEVTGNE